MYSRLGKRLYVVIAEPTERAHARSAATDAHLAYLKDIEASGHLFMAGPFVAEDGASQGGGLFILRAKNRAEAEAIAARDPYNALGYRTAHVRPWRLDQGRFSLDISYTSAKTAFD